MPKSVLFVIRLSKIVSGCLEDIFIFISGYSFLNFDIIGDFDLVINLSHYYQFFSPAF